MYETVEDTYRYLPNLPRGDLAEFGVYSGNTLLRIIQGAEQYNKPFEKVWAFDVFKGGLPAETPGVYINPDWKKGAFDISADNNLNTVEEAIEFVRNRVNRENIVYVPGYFVDTLTRSMAAAIGEYSISFCHIDCDIHSSSKEVLDFVFRYKLLMVGCLIRFDDICSTPSNGGQKLALAQITHRYKFELSQLSDNVFQLMKYEY